MIVIKVTFIMNLNTSADNIDDFGRFATLKDSVNRKIAKSYIEKLEKTEISAFKLSLKIDEMLRGFILENS